MVVVSIIAAPDDIPPAPEGGRSRPSQCSNADPVGPLRPRRLPLPSQSIRRTTQSPIPTPPGATTMIRLRTALLPTLLAALPGPARSADANRLTYLDENSL